MKIRTLSLPVFASLALAMPTQAQTVHNISSSPVQSYGNIQAAIVWASPGDVLLVAPGSYGSVLVNKPLSIFAMPGTVVSIAPALRVQGISAGERVIISGLSVQATSGYTTGNVALKVLGSAGSVYFQDCRFLGASSQFTFSCDGLDGADAAQINDSDRVAFTDCQFYGSGGYTTDDFCGTGPGQGGKAVRLSNSTVAFYTCRLRGGMDGDYWSGNWGLELINSQVYASGSGLGVWPGLPLNVPGVAVDIASAFHYRDCTFSLSPSISGSGLVNPLPGLARELNTPTLLSWATPGSASFVGDAGDQVHLLASLSAHFRWLIPIGIQQLTVTLPLPPVAGTVPAGGILPVPIDLSNLTQPATPAPVALQGFALSAGSRWLSDVRHILPLDPNAGPDCNNNGINDYLDILSGAAPDVDRNLVPDTCP